MAWERALFNELKSVDESSTTCKSSRFGRDVDIKSWPSTAIVRKGEVMLCPGEAIPNSNASTPAAGSSMVNTAEEAGVEGKVCHIDPSINRS